MEYFSEGRLVKNNGKTGINISSPPPNKKPNKTLMKLLLSLKLIKKIIVDKKI